MSFGALGLRLAGALSGDRFPLPVQAGLPVSRFAEKTGTNIHQVLIAVLAVPAIVVAVGLVWSQL